MKAVFRKIANSMDDAFHSFGLFLYIFRKERVHQYFLILMLLMIFSALAFFLVEGANNEGLIETTDDGTLLSKILAIVYWSIVTISTTGYGDIIPQTNIGRLLVVIMLFFSIAAVALFTANLASALTNKKLLEIRGIMDLVKFKGHFVICGWKDNMGKFMEELVKCNQNIQIKKITIIANIEPNSIELFRQNYPTFKDTIIIRGDHYNETMLRKANIAQAQKVIILSDESNPDSNVGVDSLTVLTAMTIRSISGNVSIAAELAEIKFEKYLKTAHVDEIIYKNEYSGALLANSLQQIGLTKVINDLLVVHNSASLVTVEIPTEYQGRKFVELRDFFQKEQDCLAIGLLKM